MGKAKRKQDEEKDGKTRILIAPSWNEDNILDICINELLENLLQADRLITVRPHPEYIKRFGPRLNTLMDRWKNKIGDGLVFETNFSSNQSQYDADILITDWSGIAYEYSYTTGKPSLFINTKIKLLNPNWEKIGIVPLEISLRDQIGQSLNKNELIKINDVIKEMMATTDKWEKQIEEVRKKNIYNPGCSGSIAAEYILKRLINLESKK